jgi:hypothetical protein
MGNRFNEKQNAAPIPRPHHQQDGFINQIDQLEDAAQSSFEIPQRGALRESVSPDERHKKRVQFAADVSGDEELKENGHTSTSSNASESPRSNPPPPPASNPTTSEQTITFDPNDNDETEPRTQIVGTREVYNNDPRQRRLNEIQAKALKPVVDGSNLAFREKMKMFAAQIGEKSPKDDRYKMSSAQRDIENDS